LGKIKSYAHEKEPRMSWSVIVMRVDRLAWLESTSVAKSPVTPLFLLLPMRTLISSHFEVHSGKEGKSKKKDGDLAIIIKY
jgi:hypothetical protein